jgi:hypothetical protein
VIASYVGGKVSLDEFADCYFFLHRQIDEFYPQSGADDIITDLFDALDAATDAPEVVPGAQEAAARLPEKAATALGQLADVIRA